MKDVESQTVEMNELEDRFLKLQRDLQRFPVRNSFIHDEL